MKNKYEIRGDVTAIFVNHKGESLETIIDTEDLPRAQEFPNMWTTEAHGGCIYVSGNLSIGYKKRKRLRLHRWLSDTPEGLVVDHINHDTLDNRRSCNLREILAKENAQNVIVQGTRGVFWNKKLRKWTAQVGVNGKKFHIGLFENIEEAENAAEKARAKLLPYSLEAYNGIETKDLVINSRPKGKESGVTGVTWKSNIGKWWVRIYAGGKYFDLGYYEDISEAKIIAEKSKIDEVFRDNHVEKIRLKPRSVNKSGVRGVRWCQTNKIWIAQIIFKKKLIFSGKYKNFQEAAKEITEFRRKYNSGF